MGELVVDREPVAEAIFCSSAVCTFIVAPAGYGKSHLARLVQRACPSAVCDLAGVRSVASLGRRIIAALLAAGMPDEGNLVQALAAMPDAPTADDSWDALLDAVCSNTRGPQFLVLENAEDIAGNRNICDRVARCARAVAGNLRLIVCSRIPLRSPSFLRLPPNDVLNLGAAELQFSKAESEALLRAAGAGDIETKRALDVAAGWPVAVLLFARDARSGKLTERLDRLRDEPDLSVYAESQVLTDFEPGLVEMLGAIARLGTANADDFIALRTTAAEISLRCEQHPFVVQNGGSITVHPIARRALTDAGAGTSVLRAAAADCTDAQIAARFLVAAGDRDAAAEILGSKLAPYMIGRVSPGLAQLVADIGAETLCRHPAAWCATIILRRCTISTEQSLSEGRAVWNMLSDATPVVVRVGVGTILVNDLLLSNRSDEAERIFPQLHRWIAQAPEETATSALIVELYERWMALRQGVISDTNDDYRRRMAFLLDAATDTRALFYYEFDAREAIMRMDWDAALRANLKAVESARLADSPTPRLIVFPAVAFFAWMRGDDALLEALATELADLNRPPTDGSCKHFLECALGDAALSLRWYELPYQSAFAEIIGASRTAGAARDSLSKAALRAAEQDGSALVLTLAWLCRAFCAPNERVAAFEQATKFASAIATGAWAEAIESLNRGRGPLVPFAARFDAVPNASIELRIAEQRLVAGKREIPLTPREIVVFLALERAGRRVSATELAATLLTDTEGSDPASALRVRINRIRAKTMPLQTVITAKSGYSLPQGFRSDVAEAEQMIQILERGRELTQEQLLRLERFARSRPDQLAIEWGDTDFGNSVIRWFEHVTRQSLLALARRAREKDDVSVAYDWAESARLRDPLDEEAVTIVVEMQARLGRHAEAERVAREFAERLFRELGAKPRAELCALLRGAYTT